MTRFLQLMGVVIILGFIAVEAYLLAHFWDQIMASQSAEKVGPLLAALFTPVVSVLTIAFSYIVIHHQFRLNEEIEKTKHKLGERFKRESDAYFKLWNAVASTYRKLAPLENGAPAYGMRDFVEEKFAEAEPYNFVTPKADEAKFFSFWQTAREVAAEAEQAADETTRKDVWRRQVAPLSQRLSELRELYRRSYLGET